MKWTFEYEGNTLSHAFAGGTKGGYYIDIWPDWFELRLDGDSVGKYDRLEKAIDAADRFDKLVEKE